MRKIKTEVLRCMTDFAASDGTLTSCFVFHEDFIGFQGHFPSGKVLPGVCQIQCIISMLEKWKKNSVTLKEIMLTKFFAPVLPSEELTCVCSGIVDTDKEFVVKAQVKKGADRVAEFKLKVCFTDETAKEKNLF